MKAPKLPPALKKVPWWGWLLGVAVLFGGGKAARDAAKPSGSPPGPGNTPAGGQVPAVLTPANASQVAAAIVAGLRAMGRGVPRQESWLFPLAVSLFETDVPPRQWRQMYNHNAGNVRVWKAGQRWYENPHEPGAKSMDFPSLAAGARGMLEAMKHHGVLDAADKGDLDAFLKAMDGYQGTAGSYSNPALHFDQIVASLRGTIVDVA